LTEANYGHVMTAKKSLSNDDGAVQTTAWRDMPVNWDGLSVTEYVNLLFRPNQPKRMEE